MKNFAYCLMLAIGLGAATAPARADELTTDEQKTLYALGVAISQSLRAFALSDSELNIVQSGMTDGVLKQPLKVDMDTYGPMIQGLAQKRIAAAAEVEKKAGTEFVAKAAAEPGAKTTASGAIVQTITEGTGPTPTAADTVTVHYVGTLTDGTQFDSSYKRGAPATFSLGGVIKCWTEGLQEIKVGGKSRLICPSDIAYGERGSPPVIKPGATLVFEVELLEIAKP